MEDENHALFSCTVHHEIRHQQQQLLAEYQPVVETLHPRNTEEIGQNGKY